MFGSTPIKVSLCPYLSWNLCFASVSLLAGMTPVLAEVPKLGERVHTSGPSILCETWVSHNLLKGTALFEGKPCDRFSQLRTILTRCMRALPLSWPFSAGRNCLAVVAGLRPKPRSPAGWWVPRREPTGAGAASAGQAGRDAPAAEIEPLEKILHFQVPALRRGMSDAFHRLLLC